MRSSSPYEVKPRQLRALVLLLMLLPLVPTAFVVRFMIEAVYSEHLDARERIRPVYQKFLEAAGSSLAVNAGRAAGPWQALVEDGAIDAALLAAPGQRLAPLPAELPAGASRRMIKAQALAQAFAGLGIRSDALPTHGVMRWRFLSEEPQPAFALCPPPPGDGGAGGKIVFLKTRQHLLDAAAAFYQRTLDPQSVLRLLDENGESIPLVGPADAADEGEPLVELPLKAPLPAWRVQLFGVGAASAEGFLRDQIVFYFWTVGGILAVTAAIVALAGFALTRRIVLQELSNDALAVVSHEMKTPLSSIRMFVDTLLDGRGPANRDEYLQLIAQENTRLERLVEGFLLLSRLDRAQARPPTLAPVLVGTIIDAACARLRPRLEASGCRFRSECAPGLPPFPADAEALTTVLVNLLDNALKYSGDGDGEKEITLRAFAERGQMVFEVRDNGPGIPRDEQEKIFQRFYQSDHRLTRAHDGCGLGLSIVESIARAHGGEVKVESAPGSGSVFSVRLSAAGKMQNAKVRRKKSEGSRDQTL